MQVQVARISPVVMELAVEVPAARGEGRGREGVLEPRSARRTCRGFRPGKAPRQVLAHLYGPQVPNDVVNALVNETLPKALDREEGPPVNQPQVEAGKFEPATRVLVQGALRGAAGDRRGELRGARARRARPSMADEKMVDEQLELLRKQHARLEAPEPARPAQKGDVVTIDFTLDVDGARSEGRRRARACSSSSAPGRSCRSSTRRSSARSVDDDARRRRPSSRHEHPREELRGKTATFHVKVKDMKQRILPALDDEFAKDVGSFQTLVELRADIHTRLEKMLEGPRRDRPRRADRRQAEREEPGRRCRRRSSSSSAG